MVQVEPDGAFSTVGHQFILAIRLHGELVGIVGVEPFNTLDLGKELFPLAPVKRPVDQTSKALARVAPDGTVRWTETCYCPTPLQHERATVLDRYFTGIETKLIDKPVTFDGPPLMDRLAAH